MTNPPAPLTGTALDQALAALPGWSVEDGRLVCVKTFDSFAATMAYVAAVGVVADLHNHHPDIDVRWRTVTLRVHTHDAGNAITERDTQLAAAVNDDRP
jgi:4a-hydroxytetrahydrobiopterin dehydratase